MKPFKPPSRVGSSSTVNSTTFASSQPREPPTKKRRISQDDDEQAANLEASVAAANVLKSKPFQAPKKFVAPARKPLQPLSIPNGSSQGEPRAEGVAESYYIVVWRKFTMKKNKTWDGDGVLSVKGTYATLQDISGGKDLGRGVCKGRLLPGSELSLGGKEIEVESIISKEDYQAGKPSLGKTKSAPPPSLKEINGTDRVTNKEQARFKKLAVNQKEQLVRTNASSNAAKSTFKAPLKNNTVQTAPAESKKPVPRHDPTAENAFVMKRPESVPRGKQIVDVVMDPLLNKALRPHQREGVAFLYECVMGMKGYTGEGAILADEMGLGKTLQTIALLWTLLKQNPIYGDAPVIKKALIVCPVTLITNWRKEFRKWLGNERIGVFVADNNKIRLTDFTKGRQYHVMIIGYEKLTKVKDQLQGDCGIDIVIADEGHRLKTSKNKAAAAIRSLNTERRIILSGTPVQNELEEFYQMVDFVNPSIMSKYTTFKKEFEVPIEKMRQPEATRDEVELGSARLKELMERTGMFILRRTAEILSKYLPPKTEYVVFCRPTEAQISVYRSIIGTQAFKIAMDTPQSVLGLINVLKKVCNSPSLLMEKNNKGEEATKADFLEGVSSSSLNRGASGKLQVLDSLLHQINSTTDEKVVLVSNYTQTLDVLAKLLTSLDYRFIRLDGSVAQNKRQDLVDRFNRSPKSNSFVFLLSTKAGGSGLNLIGASRLILFDSDWNPANDLQAMARIHRDGQKKPCYIYRLLTQGALDEKIYQRQVSKTGLADSIVDSKSTANSFTKAELRDLFTFDESEDCQTHKLLGCECGGSGQPVEPPAEDVEEEVEVDEETGIEIMRLDQSDDEDLPIVPKYNSKLMKLSEIDRDAQEAEIAREKRGKMKMLSLMRYTHFDTSRVKEKAVSSEEVDEESEVSELNVVDTAIEDAALRKVVCEEGGRVGFVFAKLSC
ncbi:hypothetical protein PRZ48_003152 [Zasmidium cellare]|uniref:Uncharacterized protein n=1 Tax=Zasmidium cellare TaxID=395010 RepID=A0ABR0EU90_ZASCE|nr:hypothetical protein PRZ48_003152 [Zasmidium cellare]